MSAQPSEAARTLFANDAETIRPTAIPGVLVVDLVVREDFRGWSKETQILRPSPSPREGFVPTRWASNYNRHAGVTRGVHAEYANKYVSLVSGELVAAIVDLREGSTFGRVELVHLTAAVALFIPIGCGNSYQTLTPDVRYTYLADDNIGGTTSYVGVDLGDPDLAIPWPVPLAEASLADADRSQPALADVTPISRNALDRLRRRHREPQRQQDATTMRRS